jgi:hypothetical protein
MELYHLVFQSLILLDHRGQLLFEFGNPPVVPAGLGLALSELSEKLRYLFHATFAAVVLLVFVDAGRFSLDRGRVSNTLCLKLSQLNPRPGLFPRAKTYVLYRACDVGFRTGKFAVVNVFVDVPQGDDGRGCADGFGGSLGPLLEHVHLQS